MTRRLEPQFQFAPHLDSRFTHNSTCQGHKSLCAIRRRRQGDRWQGRWLPEDPGLGRGATGLGADATSFGSVLGPLLHAHLLWAPAIPRAQVICSIPSLSLAPGPSPPNWYRGLSLLSYCLKLSSAQLNHPLPLYLETSRACCRLPPPWDRPAHLRATVQVRAIHSLIHPESIG